MASITWLGATYSDVPACTLPKTGGGVVKFTDVSATTAVAEDVAEGKIFFKADGTQDVGTGSGGGGSVIIEDEIDEHGGTIRTITADTVVRLQTKSGINPTESSQTISPDTGYTALRSVQINGISSTYVGSGITRRDSTDLSDSGATVTVPSGYYSSQATKSVQSGSVTAPSTISGTSASVSTGTNTLTLTKTVSVTPNVSTAGYVSSGTAGNSSVSLTASVTTKAAATITPGTTNQTIASGTYLTGTQTISGDADLVASNIISTANIFGVQGNVVIQHYYTGSSNPSSSLGVNGDIYLKT